jgi:hypothetical protein
MKITRIISDHAQRKALFLTKGDACLREKIPHITGSWMTAIIASTIRISKFTKVLLNRYD